MGNIDAAYRCGRPGNLHSQKAEAEQVGMSDKSGSMPKRPSLWISEVNIYPAKLETQMPYLPPVKARNSLSKVTVYEQVGSKY